MCSRSMLKLVSLDLEDFNTLLWRKEEKTMVEKTWKDLTLLENWHLTHSDQELCFQWNKHKEMATYVHIISDYTLGVLGIFVSLGCSVKERGREEKKWVADERTKGFGIHFSVWAGFSILACLKLRHWILVCSAHLSRL